MTREKSFSNLEAQFTIQRKRKLIIINKKKAQRLFLTKNYFNFINGFEDLLLKDNSSNSKKYSNFKTISDFNRIYKLDKQISKSLFYQLSNVEIELKSNIAYYFCEKYCIDGVIDNLKYEDISCYTIPDSNSGLSQYVHYFYKTDSRGKLNNKKTHKLFSKHTIPIHTNNLIFSGIIEPDNRPQHPNEFHLKGRFTGSLKGLRKNEFEGTLIIDRQRNNINSISDSHQNNVTISLNDVDGKFTDLSYSDYCKIKYPHISSYRKPPFWVIINTLMLNDLIILFHGLDRDIQNSIVKKMGNFDIHNGGKEEFLNALDIVKQLRNKVAHHEIVTRFKTDNNIPINAGLIRRLDLKPRTANLEIKLYDTIIVLNEFYSFKMTSVKFKIRLYMLFNIILLNNDINKKFKSQIGL